VVEQESETSTVEAVPVCNEYDPIISNLSPPDIDSLLSSANNITETTGEKDSKK
jgi:hypothetical protein